jgi:hypothetical protein
MTFWQLYLTSLGGTATALLGAGFLGRTLIEQWFRKDFKRFEAKLDQVASAEQTKFSWLHTKRAETVSELYGKLAKVDYMLTKLLAQEGIKAQMATSEGVEYIKSEVAKYAEETADLIENIAESVLSTLIYFESDSRTHLLRATAYLQKLSLLHLHKADLLQNVTKAQLSDAKATEAINDTRKYLEETKNELEGEFRRLLGVENKTELARDQRGDGVLANK